MQVQRLILLQIRARYGLTVNYTTEAGHKKKNKIKPFHHLKDNQGIFEQSLLFLSNVIRVASFASSLATRTQFGGIFHLQFSL